MLFSMVKTVMPYLYSFSRYLRLKVSPFCGDPLWKRGHTPSYLAPAICLVGLSTLTWRFRIEWITSKKSIFHNKNVIYCLHHIWEVTWTSYEVNCFELRTKSINTASGKLNYYYDVLININESRPECAWSIGIGYQPFLLVGRLP